jgi:DNA-binding PadR family transcriptional regulator
MEKRDKMNKKTRPTFPMDGATLKGEFPIYETLKLLQEGLCISEIAKYRHVNRSSVYKILKTLNKKGFIRHPKYSLYELTEKGVEGLHSFVGLRYKFRQHNLHFKCKVLESPRNWELKRNEIRQIPYFNKSLKLKNNEQDLLNYGKIQIKTTTQSIIIKMPTIYAKDWEHAIIQAMSILEDKLFQIEKIFKVRLVKDYKANITIISQEYAKIQDALAKLYRKEKNRIYLTGEDGKIWLITDFSFSTNETEFIHPEKATDDVDAIAPFLNDLRKNPTTLTDIRQHVGELQGVLNADMKNRVKHQAVLDEILITFRKINDRLEKAGI